MTTTQIIAGIFVLAVLGFSFWQFAYGGGKKENGRWPNNAPFW